jgi:hypothetical protein
LSKEISRGERSTSHPSNSLSTKGFGEACNLSTEIKDLDKCVAVIQWWKTDVAQQEKKFIKIH